MFVKGVLAESGKRWAQRDARQPHYVEAWVIKPFIFTLRNMMETSLSISTWLPF